MRRYYIVMLYRGIRFVYQYLFIWLCITLCTSIPITRHIESEWLQYFDSGSQGPGSYVFGYDVEDASTNNVQFRHEHRNGNGTVVGSYGLLEPDGNLRIVHYVADQLGYRAQIENTKRQNEVYPHPTLYKEIINKLNSANDINSELDEKTESSFLQSAEQHLPLLGQNYVHEKHTPPIHEKNISPIQESDFKNENNPISRLYSDYNYYY